MVSLPSFTSADVFIVKTDAGGKQQWSRIYEDTATEDFGRGIATATDGGYAVTGNTYPISTLSQGAFLMKTDKDGNRLWNKTYGKSMGACGAAIVGASDGGYAIAGYGYSVSKSDDAVLIKTDSAGNQQWLKTYGGANYEEAWSILLANDGGYAIAGNQGSNGSSDVFVLKTDSDGNQQWNKTYSSPNYDRTSWSIAKAPDGGYVMAGSIFPSGEPSLSDYLLIKTNSESGLAWTASNANALTVYRGETDIYWNFVRVQVWKIK